MFRILFLFCVTLVIQLQSLCHAQTAYLRQYQIFSGDIAELTIEYDNRIPSLYALDTSVLEADFEILDIKSSVSRMLESNKAFHRMRWQIEILPRSPGKLRIPPLQVGEVFTPVLMLEVITPPAQLNSANKVQVELEAQPERPYAGQQTQIVIRVIHNVPLFDGNLIEPTIDNADTYSHGKESRYAIFLDGRKFQVRERNLSIVARLPGQIRIPPVNYRGRIQSPIDTSMTGATRFINRASKALTLEVRKPPSEFSGDTWLPARELKLDQHWDEISNDLRVGDSLGLTLGIEAKGLPAEALPAGLLSIDSEKVRVYADQETRSNRFVGREIVGRLQQSFVVVVTQPGEIELPAINLKWWDVEQEVERIAALAGNSWTVPAPETGEDGFDTAERATSGSGTGSPGLVSSLAHSNWSWYAGIGAILLIPGLLICFRSVRVRLSESIAAMLKSRRNRQLLKQACIANNPVLACRELITWGKARWPRENINGLYQIRIRIRSTELAAELRRLDKALYADRGETWQGRALWRLVAAEHRLLTAENDTREDSLPDLYPQRS
ncbi:MAG: BatD family protein [Gammaproteobacteria bacterium]|nr:BatD family protein [Gammaproteobacteria bacterium]